MSLTVGRSPEVCGGSQEKIAIGEIVAAAVASPNLERIVCILLLELAIPVEVATGYSSVLGIVLVLLNFQSDKSRLFLLLLNSF